MDKDQYQEPEVAYEADEGITAIACSVRPFYRGLFSLKYNRGAPRSWAIERALAVWKQRL